MMGGRGLMGSEVFGNTGDSRLQSRPSDIREFAERYSCRRDDENAISRGELPRDIFEWTTGGLGR